jgi:hypothetical protein
MIFFGLRCARQTVVLALLTAGAFSGLAAQSAGGSAAGRQPVFADDVVFVVRVDGASLARSPVLERLLRQPEAANGLAQALGRAGTLAKVRSVYVGFPERFTLNSTELPVLVVGDFTGPDLVADLAGARGVKPARLDGRELLEATGGGGTTYAASLGEGRLAVGDLASVLRMLEVGEGKRPAGDAPASIAAGDADIVGAGRIPPALRDYLRTAGGVGAPLSAVDRASFSASLDQAMDVRASLHVTTPEARQALQQALGALVMFGPSRFANDPEVLSAVQSLRFAVASDGLDLTLTIPRSLLLRVLGA